MKNKDVYISALNLIAQSDRAESNEDYEERAPYLLAAFCSEVREMDREYRKAHGLCVQTDFNDVYMALDRDFPACHRFSAPACLYLAAMLIIDEDGALSDKFYEKYCDAISSVYSEIPAELDSIRNIYSGF